MNFNAMVMCRKLGRKVVKTIWRPIDQRLLGLHFKVKFSRNSFAAVVHSCPTFPAGVDYLGLFSTACSPYILRILLRRLKKKHVGNFFDLAVWLAGCFRCQVILIYNQLLSLPNKWLSLPTDIVFEEKTKAFRTQGQSFLQ